MSLGRVGVGRKSKCGAAGLCDLFREWRPMSFDLATPTSVDLAEAGVENLSCLLLYCTYSCHLTVYQISIVISYFSATVRPCYTGHPKSSRFRARIILGQRQAKKLREKIGIGFVLLTTTERTQQNDSFRLFSARNRNFSISGWVELVRLIDLFREQE